MTGRPVRPAVTAAPREAFLALGAPEIRPGSPYLCDGTVVPAVVVPMQGDGLRLYLYSPEAARALADRFHAAAVMLEAAIRSEGDAAAALAAALSGGENPSCG